MPIEFFCTGCRQLLRTADDTAGQQAKCPACGAIVPIPQSSTGASGPPPESRELQGVAGTGQADGDFNPYQATSASYVRAPSAPYAIGSALERVRGPARGLTIIGILAIIVYFVLGIVMSIMAITGFQPQAAATPFEELAQKVGVGIAVFVDVVGFLLSALMVYGSRCMARLLGYRWAMAASITSIVMPLGGCASGCCLAFFPLAAGIPIGIWSITVLVDQNVKRAFQQRSIQQPFQPPFDPTSVR